MLQYVLSQLKDPEQFLGRVKYLYAHKNEKSRDEIQFKDGRVFDRYSSPLLDSNDKYYGRVWYLRDITERKKMDEELRESEERFRTIFDNAPDGLLVADAESKKIYTANKTFCQMLGYEPEEIKSLGVEDIHPKKDLPCIMKQFEKQSRREIALDKNTPVERKDGSVFYADINSFPMTLAGKRYLMGVFRDITERKKAEEALRESENKYRTLLGNLPQKIFLKDGNSVYVSCNDNLARDFKIKSEEIAGKTDYDFFSKELAEKYRADDKRIIETEQTEDIEESYIQEGREVIVHTVKTPVKDAQGNVIGILGIFWDITERKRAEEAYRAIVGHSLQGFEILQDERVVFANQAMAEITGYTVEEMLAMSSQQVQAFVHPEDQALVWGRHRDRLKGKELPERYEFRGIRKDGTMCWLEIHARRIEYQGKPAVQVAYLDITERKRAEEALQKARDELEIRVEQRTADLAKANVQLRSLASELSLAEERLRRRFAMDVHDHVGQNLAISKIKIESEHTVIDVRAESSGPI
jgi:PAS domain S-box-containing protein